MKTSDQSDQLARANVHVRSLSPPSCQPMDTRPQLVTHHAPRFEQSDEIRRCNMLDAGNPHRRPKTLRAIATQALGREAEISCSTKPLLESNRSRIPQIKQCLLMWS